MPRSFTIHTGSGTGRYKTDTPMEAAKKAAAKLFKDTKSKSLTFCIRETTKDSKKKLYHYKATRTAKGVIQVSVNKNKKIVSAYTSGGVGGDVRTIIIKLSEPLKLIDLFKIFYNNFDNLQILFDNIKINDFVLRSRTSADQTKKYKIVSEHKVCIRAVFFSYGSYILYKKFGGFFSNMFLFMYFLVEYCKENNIDINENYRPDKGCILYLLNFMPLNDLHMEYKSEKDSPDYDSVKIWWFNNMEIELKNTIQDHIFTGGSRVPHFFISSATEPKKSYLQRTKTFIENSNDVMNNLSTNNKDYKQPIPIYIYFKSGELNQCVDTDYEDDHVFAPYISKQHIIKIVDENQIELSYTYLDDYFADTPSTNIKTPQPITNPKTGFIGRVVKKCNELFCLGSPEAVSDPARQL